jgi:AcrR family transcriptional regulator
VTLNSARRLLAERGYAATTIAAVAADAEVVQETVYATVGRKPEIFHLLLVTATSGSRFMGWPFPGLRPCRAGLRRGADVRRSAE